jgi:hypothetical protein
MALYQLDKSTHNQILRQLESKRAMAKNAHDEAPAEKHDAHHARDP